MDLYMKEDIKKILIKRYGEQARNWEINDRVAEIVLEMLQEANYCTHLMDYVPRPYNPFSNPLKALAKDAITRLFKHAADDDINLTCMKGMIGPYRSKIQTAY